MKRNKGMKVVWHNKNYKERHVGEDKSSLRAKNSLVWGWVVSLREFSILLLNELFLFVPGNFQSLILHSP